MNTENIVNEAPKPDLLLQCVTSSFESFVYRIYKDLKRFDQRINYVEKADVLQEIRFALLTARKEQIYRVAHRLVDNLLSDYGYSRKKGKDNFQPFYSEPEFSDTEKEVLEQIEKLYLNENHTAKDIAIIFDIEFNNQLQKILCACFPKQMGKGGKRKNAGNNKHLINNNFKVSTL
jgi:hypothetical protein